MTGKFSARVFNEPLKAEAGIGKTALKRARAQAELFRYIFQRRTLPGHGSAESLLHLFADVCPRVLGFQFRLQMRAKHLQHFSIMSNERGVQITAPKNEGIAFRFKTHPAAKM